MSGSLRKRGPDSWELRVYLGVDADTGRERWATKTVHGTRRHATGELAVFVEEAGCAPARSQSCWTAGWPTPRRRGRRRRCARTAA